LSTTDLLNTVTRDVLNTDEDTGVSEFCFADAEVTCDVWRIVHRRHRVSRTAEGVVAVVDSRAVVAVHVCFTQRVKPCNEWITDITGTVQRHFRTSRDRCVLWCTNQRRFHHYVYKCTRVNGPQSCTFISAFVHCATTRRRKLCDHDRLSVILQCKISTKVISRFHWNLVLWLGLPIGRTDYFDGDAVPHTDSGSLFHFPNHSRIRDFMRFISISYFSTVTGRILPRDAMHSADYAVARCPSVRHMPVFYGNR